VYRLELKCHRTNAAIDRSGGNWNKMLAMTRSFALFAPVRAAAAAPAGYYYVREAGTS
jgi:hypothetical protein